MRWFPQSPPLLWLLAQSAFQMEDFATAAKILENLVHLGRTGTYNQTAPFDSTIMTEPAIFNLASCYVRLGELERAEFWFGQLLTSKTHHAQARQALNFAKVSTPSTHL